MSTVPLRPLVAIDTEKGGFKPAENALLSMSFIELDAQLVPVRQIELFILPEPDRAVSEGAAKINGYTPALWSERKAMPLREAFQAAKDWIAYPGAIALAHNARFDCGFIEHQESRLGIQLGFAAEWECSLDLFRKSCRPLALSVANHKLETLARLCGHWNPDFVRGAHGATEDALACAAGYRWLKERLAAKQQAKGVARG